VWGRKGPSPDRAFERFHALGKKGGCRKKLEKVKMHSSNAIRERNPAENARPDEGEALLPRRGGKIMKSKKSRWGGGEGELRPKGGGGS